MPQNYAAKYSPLVDERFRQVSLTEAAFNQDYDWEGVATVNVYSVNTAPLVNYTLTGMSRYGTPDELGTTTQAMTLSQDKAFTYTVDRRNYLDSQMVTEAGRSLSRQVEEVIIPHVDTYRLGRLVAGAGTTSAVTVITSDNAYESFINGVEVVKSNKAPTAGSIAFISGVFFKKIRLDPSFIKSGDLSQTMLVRGSVGMVEDINLVFCPTGYLPANVGFVITNRVAAVAPQKIVDYKIHDNPPGVNGWLVEGRHYFDAFVLGNKNKAIYVHKIAA